MYCDECKDQANAALDELTRQRDATLKALYDEMDIAFARKTEADNLQGQLDAALLSNRRDRKMDSIWCPKCGNATPVTSSAPHVCHEKGALALERDALRAEITDQANVMQTKIGMLQIDNAKLRAEVERLKSDGAGDARQIHGLQEKLDAALLQLSEVPKKLLDAALAEQDRCAKIAEVFWDGAEKLNADLRADKTQAEKSMAYMISTNIRALRRRESDFAQKPKQEAQIGDRPQDICALCYHPNDDVAHQRCLAERATLKRIEQSRKEPSNMCHETVKFDGGPIYCYQPLPCRIHG